MTVPFGTDVTNLMAVITIPGGTIVNPTSWASQDFTNPVTYTVTALDNSTQAYTVAVTVAAPAAMCSISCNAGDSIDTTPGDPNEGMCIQLPTCGEGCKATPTYYTPTFNNCQSCGDCDTVCSAQFTDCAGYVSCFGACSSAIAQEGAMCRAPMCLSERK